MVDLVHLASLGVTVVPKRQKRPKGDSPNVKEPVFQRYHAESLLALQDSMREAKGRFDISSEMYEPYTKAEGSPNWRVVAGAQGMSEMVDVFYKVGRRSKIELFKNPEDGSRTSTVTVPFKMVTTVLEAMMVVLNKKDFKDSENGKLFHEAAKKAAWPTVKRDTFKFDDEMDMWVKK
ncbi:hypothetical protein N9V92_03450 [Luminiphilus sp.]|nr:hypothetical protein [Luminiphilus sp.]